MPGTERDDDWLCRISNDALGSHAGLIRLILSLASFLGHTEREVRVPHQVTNGPLPGDKPRTTYAHCQRDFRLFSPKRRGELIDDALG